MISLAVDGRRFTDWTSAEVTRSLDALASSFRVDAGLRRGSALGIFSGAAVRVDGPDGVMLTGYVDEITIETSADGYSVAIPGRSATADLVDSDIPQSRVWRGTSATAILRELAAMHGLTVTVDAAASAAASTALPRIVAEAGRPVADVVESVARAARVVVTDDPTGGLRIYQVGTDRAPELRVGANVLTSRVTAAASQLFARYVVRGQTALAGAEDVEVWGAQLAEVADPAGARARVKVAQPPEGMGREDCARYAQWLADTAAAQALTVSATVAGWAYAPGQLARYVDPFAGIDTELIVRECTWSYSADAGSSTSLLLGPPVAYEPARTVRPTRTNPQRGIPLWGDVEAYGASLLARVLP